MIQELHCYSLFIIVVKTRLRPEDYWAPLQISIPVGRMVVLYLKYRGVEVSFYRHQFFSNVEVLSMMGYNIINAMDWFSQFRVLLDCFARP